LQRFQLIGQRLASALGLVGLFGVDAVMSAGCTWVLEVNPRWTASVEMLERARQASAVACHVAACREGVLPRDTPIFQGATAADAHAWVGKVVLFARRSVIVPRELTALVEAHLDVPWPDHADIPEPQSTIRQGRPVLTVLSSGKSRDEVLGNLRQRAAEVEALLVQA
jgi:predicted ATP-grasp superfamily ATP-dependent carboligase